MRVFYRIVTHGLPGEFQFLHTGRSVGIDNIVIANLCFGKTAKIVVSINGDNTFGVGMLEHRAVGGILIAVLTGIRILDRCLIAGIIVSHHYCR